MEEKSEKDPSILIGINGPLSASLHDFHDRIDYIAPAIFLSLSLQDGRRIDCRIDRVRDQTFFCSAPAGIFCNPIIANEHYRLARRDDRLAIWIRGKRAFRASRRMAQIPFGALDQKLKLLG